MWQSNLSYWGEIMSNYKIIADSCIDLPDSLAKELNIEVIPLKVTVDGKEYTNYLDEREISFEKFYDFLREHKTAVTAQANPQDFIDILTPHLKKGEDILLILFSSALSGTYNSSLIAAKELKETFTDRKIICIDSKCASMGQGLLATYAANLQKNGKTIHEVAQYVEDTKLRISHLFTVSDLGHLRRGGRLSAGKEFIGNILNIKPLLHVSMNGHLKVYGKARGRYKALNQLISRMQETFDDTLDQLVYISHGDCIEDALYVKQNILEKFNVKEENIVINHIGPVIGAHSGVNTLAIFYIGNERELKA